jgi:prepilin-type N-terminal cleavage/methylation domain-containing protein
MKGLKLLRLKNSGFTLIELLVAISVSAIAGTVLVSMLLSSNRVFVSQSTEVTQGLSLNSSISEIKDLIRESVAVNAQYPISGSPQYLTGANVLVLKLPAKNNDGNIVENVFDYAVITSDVQKNYLLKKIVFPNILSSRKTENKVLSTNLKQITFYYFDAVGNIIIPTQSSRINLSINLIEKQGPNQKESSASADVNLKNI